MDASSTATLPSNPSRSRLKTPTKANNRLMPGFPGDRRCSVMPGGRKGSIMPGHDTRRMSDRKGLSDFSIISDSSAELVRSATKRMEPTYQLHPTSAFTEKQVRKIANDMLELYLKDVSYEPEQCRSKSKEVARAIMDSLKRIGVPRFKIVAVVNIGNLKDFSTVQISSRSVWNDKTDKFITAEFRTKELYAVAMVYTLYTE